MCRVLTHCVRFVFDVLCAQPGCEVFFRCFVCSDMMYLVFWMGCVLSHDVRCVLYVLCALT